MRYTIFPLLGPIALILGLALLAVHPLLWLVGTWFDPAYDSYGFWVAALTFGLLLWSATSPLRVANSRQRLSGLGLLALTAAIRLLGQWLGINVLGAAALAVDVYAIGLLLGLERRARPLAPGWLAVLFAFALPIERILQRGFGFALQQISAVGACTALGLGAPVQCEGNLPCSGTRGLLLLLLLYVALAVLTRPTLGRAILGALLTLAAATLGNSLRIVALAVGLVHREALGGVDVPPGIERQRAQLLDAMVDSQFALGAARVAVAADPDLLAMLCDTLVGQGTEVIVAVGAAASPALAQLAAQTVMVGDLEDLERQARARQAHLIVTNSHGVDIAARLGCGLLRAGYPLNDLAGAQARQWIGYRGTRQLLFDLVNALTLSRPSKRPYRSKLRQFAEASPQPIV